MKSRPFFSISPALIRENFKMFWYLPALSFTAYFLAGIFPLIVNPHYLTDPNHWYLEDCLMNWNVAFVCLLIAAPLVGAIVMMNYLHNPARAMTIHAQPFSRTKIFWSHTLTGWLMCILPPMVMTLIYLLIAGDPGHSLLFGASSLAILTFFYGIFIFAGVLVGTSVMHVLLCGIFFGILPLVLWLTILYCENFLIGFWNMPDWMERFLFDTNPILWQIAEGGEWFEAGRIAAYLAVGLAFTALAALLYNRAKLEHVGDSMIFRAAEEIITWLVVFVGMTVFGLFFYSVLDEKIMALIGMVFGTLLAFIIVKIVLNRTIKIINRQNLLSLGAFALILAVFAGGTMYDLTGFTRRVPEASKVASVQRVDFSYGNSFQFWYDYIEDDLLLEQETLTSPEAIEKVIALHQYIVDNELYNYDYTSGGAVVYDSTGEEVYRGNSYVTLRYTLNNGREMTRRFDFRMNQEIADLMNAVTTDREYLDDGALVDIFTPENISYIELSVYDYSFEYDYKDGKLTDVELDEAYRNAQANLVFREEEEIAALLEAIEKDHYSSTYTWTASSYMDYNLMTQASDTAPLTDDFDSMDYIDISGSIYLKPGTDGVLKEWKGTAPESNSKPVGTARFSVRRSHKETLTWLAEFLREEGYDSHADHIQP